MDRAHKTVLWIEKFRCQNSNLDLPTIKNGFYSFRILKIRFISKSGSFYISETAESYRSLCYAGLVHSCPRSDVMGINVFTCSLIREGFES